jgi:flagellar protein FlaG
MEKVTSGEPSAGAGLRVANVAVERKERATSPVPNTSVSDATAPTELSIAAVAAQAEEGKVRSLSTLASVTKSMEEAVEVLNQALSLKNTSAVIRRDEQLNRYLVTIKDKESGEIVREIPDEALIKFARNLQELRGILFDETT